MAASPFLLDARPRRLFFPQWKPAAAALAVSAFVLAGGGTVLAAQAALPGDALYVVKLAAEKAQEGVSISAHGALSVHASHATRRLEEAERLMKDRALTDEDRTQRVCDALQGYEEQIFHLSETALRWPVSDPARRRSDRMIQAVEGMLDRHAALIEATTIAQPAVAEAVLEPVETALDLQDTLLETAELPAEPSSSPDDLIRRHQQRAEKIQDELQSLQLQLRDAKILAHAPQS